MIISYKLIVVYPLLTFSTEINNDFIPYQTYTKTNLMQNYEIKVYERFWNNLIKEHDSDD